MEDVLIQVPARKVPSIPNRVFGADYGAYHDSASARDIP